MTRDVGKLTVNPTPKALLHFSKNVGINPMFTRVRTKDIEKDIPNDMKNPNKIVEYFLSIFNRSPA